jgi:hypothetical protein
MAGDADAAVTQDRLATDVDAACPCSGGSGGHEEGGCCGCRRGEVPCTCMARRQRKEVPALDPCAGELVPRCEWLLLLLLLLNDAVALALDAATH